MNEICEICNKPVGDVTVGTGTGVVHLECFDLKMKPRKVSSIYEMVRSHRDPLEVADLILCHVEPDVARAIVDDYNRNVVAKWERRTGREYED